MLHRLEGLWARKGGCYARGERSNQGRTRAVQSWSSKELGLLSVTFLKFFGRTAMARIVTPEFGARFYESFWFRRLAIYEIPQLLLFSEGGNFAVLIAAASGFKVGHKVDDAGGVRWPAVFGGDNFKTMPLRFLCPFLGCFAVKICATFGGMRLFDEINASGGVARVARTHERFGSSCRGLLCDDRFAAQAEFLRRSAGAEGGCRHILIILA